MQYNTVVIGEYITTKKQPKIAILIKLKLLNSLITQKHRNKEKMSIINAILFDYLLTCN